MSKEQLRLRITWANGDTEIVQFPEEACPLGQSIIVHAWKWLWAGEAVYGDGPDGGMIGLNPRQVRKIEHAWSDG